MIWEVDWHGNYFHPYEKTIVSLWISPTGQINHHAVFHFSFALMCTNKERLGKIRGMKRRSHNKKNGDTNPVLLTMIWCLFQLLSSLVGPRILSLPLW